MDDQLRKVSLSSQDARFSCGITRPDRIVGDGFFSSSEPRPSATHLTEFGARNAPVLKILRNISADCGPRRKRRALCARSAPRAANVDVLLDQTRARMMHTLLETGSACAALRAAA